MRLTLRTLLAYLDDTLEPHETRELGKKIQESPVASALVSRVREVIRKRRLGAPEVDGPAQGIDPNVVAQYLDNNLSPEQVGQVEAICLESDLVLAEVAACHQILSSIQGEPVEMSLRSLERFYALGPVSAEGQFQANRADQTAASPAGKAVTARHAPVAPISESAGHFRDELVGQLKTPNWPNRIGPAVGAALVIAALVLVLAADRDLFRGMVKPNTNKSGESIVAKNDTPRPNAADAKEKTPTPQPDTSPKMATTGAEVASTATPTPSPTTEPTPKPAPSNSDVVDATSVLPKPATPVITAPTPQPPSAELDKTITVPVHSISVEGVLLRYQPADNHWYVQPRRSELHAGEVFACPDPYEAILEWDQGLLKATLMSDTVVQILPSTEERRYNLLVRRGRVLLQPGPMARGSMNISLAVGNKSHDITLTTAATTVGVEVKIEEPRGYPAADFPDPYRAVLYVETGEVKLADDKTLSAKQFGRLTGPAADSVTVSSQWPNWLDPARGSSLSPLKRFDKKFEEQFDPKIAVELAIPAVIKDKHPDLANLASKCVALIENYPAMVQALTQLDHKEARDSAAEGLRTWLALDPGNGELLRRELEMQLPGEEAQAVERLLWGYTRAQLKDKLISQELVELLRSNHLVVRELTFQQLVQLTGRRNNYQPNGSVSQRELGIQHWQNQIKRDGALLKPDE